MCHGVHCALQSLGKFRLLGSVAEGMRCGEADPLQRRAQLLRDSCGGAIREGEDLSGERGIARPFPKGFVEAVRRTYALYCCAGKRHQPGFAHMPGDRRMGAHLQLQGDQGLRNGLGKLVKAIQNGHVALEKQASPKQTRRAARKTDVTVPQHQRFAAQDAAYGMQNTQTEDQKDRREERQKLGLCKQSIPSLQADSNGIVPRSKAVHTNTGGAKPIDTHCPMLYNIVCFGFRDHREGAVWMHWRKCFAIWMLLLVCLLLPCVQTLAEQGFLPTRMYDCVMYQARPASETTTSLLIGYDHDAEGALEELHGYSHGGQADFLLLVQLDHRSEKIRMLQIDRDTMTAVHMMDDLGTRRGAFTLQICLAHAFGSTREENNANTVRAVEDLLKISGDGDGAQIDWYLAMDISGISRLNDLLGGVTVNLEDDLSALDPAMTPGATLRLTGEQAERFCRGRYGVGDQTNASRMRRQRQYMAAAGETLMAKLREDPDFANDLLKGMGLIYDRAIPQDNPFAPKENGTPVGDTGGKYLMSSETLSGIVAAMSRAVSYQMLATETLPGVHQRGTNGFVQFIVEEDAAQKWAIDAMYRPLE